MTTPLSFPAIYVESVSHSVETSYQAGVDAASRYPITPYDIWNQFDDVPDAPPAGLVANNGPVPGAGPVELVTIYVDPRPGQPLRWEESAAAYSPAPPGLAPHLRSVVPATFGTDETSVFGAYAPVLVVDDAARTPVPFDGHSWAVDGLNHIVEFQTGAPAAAQGRRLILSFYRYTGVFGGTAGGLSGVNAYSYTGTGNGLIVSTMVAPNVSFRRIAADTGAGRGISVETVGDDIVVSNTLSTAHQGGVAGSGEICIGKVADAFVYRRLVGAGNVAVSYAPDGSIVITGTGGAPASGGLLTLANLSAAPGALGWWRDLGALNSVANLRSLVVDAASGLSAVVTGGDTEITLENTLTGQNTGGGFQLFRDKQAGALRFRTLFAGAGIVIDSDNLHPGALTISSQNSPTTGIQTLANVGGGVGLWRDVTLGTIANLYSLAADPGIGLMINADRVVVSNTLQGTNLGAGARVYKQKTALAALEFRTLYAGYGIQLDVDTAHSGGITISYSGAAAGLTAVAPSTGPDQSLVDTVPGQTSTAVLRRLRAGAGIVLSPAGAPGSEYITVAVTGAVMGAIVNATGTGLGAPLVASVAGQLLRIKDLAAGAGIVLTQTANLVTISSAGGGSGGLIAVNPSLGGGLSLVDTAPQTTAATIRRLVAGSNVNLVLGGAQTSQYITVHATVPVTSVAAGGAGAALVDGNYSGAATLVGLAAGAGIQIVPGGSPQNKTLTIVATGTVAGALTSVQTSAGSGVALVDSAPQSATAYVRRLVAGTGIGLVATTSAQGSEYVTVSSTIPPPTVTALTTGTGGGADVFTGMSGTTGQFATIVAGSNISIFASGTASARTIMVGLSTSFLGSVVPSAGLITDISIVDTNPQINSATLRRLRAGAGIAVASGGSQGNEYVTITATGAVSGAVTSVTDNTAIGVSLRDTTSTAIDIALRKVAAGAGINVSVGGAPGAETVTIASTVVGGSVVDSLGGSTSILDASSTPSAAVLRTLTGGTGITVTPGGLSGSGEVVITSTIVGGTVADSVAAGASPLDSSSTPSAAVLRRFVAGSGVAVAAGGAPGSETLTVSGRTVADSGAASVPLLDAGSAGLSTILRRLAAGTGINVSAAGTNGSQEITIDCSVVGGTVADSTGGTVSLRDTSATASAAVLRRLTAGTGITVSSAGASGAEAITIATTVVGGTTVDSTAGGNSLQDSTSTASATILRTLTAGTGITIVSSGLPGVETLGIYGPTTSDSTGGTVALRDAGSTATATVLRRLTAGTGITLSTAGASGAEAITVATTVVGGTVADSTSGVGLPLQDASSTPSAAVLRKLAAGTGITITNLGLSGAQALQVACTVVGGTVADAVGSSFSLQDSTTTASAAVLRRISAGTGITLSTLGVPGSEEIVVTGPSFAASTGGGASLYDAGSTATGVVLRRLVAGTNINITSGGSSGTGTITIDSVAAGGTVVDSTGTGVSPLDSTSTASAAVLRQLVAGTGMAVAASGTAGAETITITGPTVSASTGGGTSLLDFGSSAPATVLRTLTAGTGITIASSGGASAQTITVSSTVVGGTTADSTGTGTSLRDASATASAAVLRKLAAGTGITLTTSGASGAQIITVDSTIVGGTTADSTGVGVSPLDSTSTASAAVLRQLVAGTGIGIASSGAAGAEVITVTGPTTADSTGGTVSILDAATTAAATVLRRFTAGTGITVTTAGASGAQAITIASTIVGGTVVDSLGVGASLQDVASTTSATVLRTLVAGTGITVAASGASGAQILTVSSTVVGGTVADSTGTGTSPLDSSSTASAAVLRQLVAGTAIGIATSGASGAEVVTITGPTTAASAGGTVSLVDAGSSPTATLIKRLTAGTGMTVGSSGTNGSQVVTITCNVVGGTVADSTGTGVSPLDSTSTASAAVLRQLVAGTAIGIASSGAAGAEVITITGPTVADSTGGSASLIDASSTASTTVLKTISAGTGITVTASGASGAQILTVASTVVGGTTADSTGTGTSLRDASSTSSAAVLRKLAAGTGISVLATGASGAQILTVSSTVTVADSTGGGTTLLDSNSVAGATVIRTLAGGLGMTLTTGGAGGAETVTIDGPTFSPSSGGSSIFDIASSPTARIFRGLAAGTGMSLAVTGGGTAQVMTFSSTVVGGTTADSTGVGTSLRDASATASAAVLRKLVAGTNITLTPSGASGAQVITIDAAGGGGGTVADSAASGTPLLDNLSVPSTAILRRLVAGTGISLATGGGAGSEYIQITNSAGSPWYWITSSDTGSVATIAPVSTAAGAAAPGQFIFDETSGFNPSSEGAGTRLFFEATNGSIRAGQVTDTRWNASSRGNASVAMGYNTRASGLRSGALSGSENQVVATGTSDYAVVAGGSLNVIGLAQTADGSAILGGIGNRVGADGDGGGASIRCVIVGGYQNLIANGLPTISGNPDSSFIGGGDSNVIGATSLNTAGPYNVIVGGNLNSIIGGTSNSEITVANAILGGQQNKISAPAAGGNASRWNVICGGGSAATGNTIGIVRAVSNCAIVGGSDNAINGDASADFDASYSLIGGGQFNEIFSNTTSSSAYSVICGGGGATTGEGNKIGRGGYASFIGGGDSNYINYTGAASLSNYCVIVGGFQNQILAASSGVYCSNSTIGGGEQNQIGGNTDVWTQQYTTIAGGSRNKIGMEFGGEGCTIGGGVRNVITSQNAGSGLSYTSTDRANCCTISGGQFNTITSSGGIGALSDYASIGGGKQNLIGLVSSAKNATIAGGFENSISSWTDVNTAAVFTDQDQHSTIGGGRNNFITGSQTTYSSYSNTIAGGEFNKVGGRAGMSACTISGGSTNHIGYSADPAFAPTAVSGWGHVIAGGDGNEILTPYPSIDFNNNNTISGGSICLIVGGDYNTICGGQGNKIGQFIGGERTDGNIVLGGISNNIQIPAAAGTAGSLCSGTNGLITHPGNWLWAGPGGTLNASIVNNGFTISAGNTVRVCAATNGVELLSNATAWSAASDWTLKRNIVELDYGRVLEGVMSLPVYEFRYRNSADDTMRNFGPMAQDWAALVPTAEAHSGSVANVDVMALAAVRGLGERVAAQQASIESLTATVAAQQEQIRDLLGLVARLEAFVTKQ